MGGRALAHPILLATAAIIIIIGFLMMRWAGRYDAAGIATDAAWRMAWRRSVDGARDELGKVIDEQTKDIRADAARIGVGRTAVKHGGRFLIARFVGIAGIVMMLLGIATGATAFLWK